jgi:hypothetical protein
MHIKNLRWIRSSVTQQLCLSGVTKGPVGLCVSGALVLSYDSMSNSPLVPGSICLRQNAPAACAEKCAEKKEPLAKSQCLPSSQAKTTAPAALYWHCRPGRQPHTVGAGRVRMRSASAGASGRRMVLPCQHQGA